MQIVKVYYSESKTGKQNSYMRTSHDVNWKFVHMYLSGQKVNNLATC